MKDALELAMELFPKLSYEERLMVHELIKSLRRSQEHDDDQQEKDERNPQS